MPVSEQPLVERVARVLCAAEHSSNAEGDEQHAAAHVDRHWRTHMNAALAVLHTMREPDRDMASEGDPEIWSRMVEVAISKYGD